MRHLSKLIFFVVLQVASSSIGHLSLSPPSLIDDRTKPTSLFPSSSQQEINRGAAIESLANVCSAIAISSPLSEADFSRLQSGLSQRTAPLTIYSINNSLSPDQISKLEALDQSKIDIKHSKSLKSIDSKNHPEPVDRTVLSTLYEYVGERSERAVRTKSRSEVTSITAALRSSLLAGRSACR